MGGRRTGIGRFTTWLSDYSGAFTYHSSSCKGVVLSPLFEEVAITGSTNADLIVRANNGASEGLWLRADHQHAGRGRMGRSWGSATGNLFASTIVRIGSGDPPASSLAFVVAIAVYETVQQIAPDVSIFIKWPNDLLTNDGAKLCGMLLERAGDAVVIGVGLNLFGHPQGMERAVTNLHACGANPPHAQAVCEMLAAFMQDWLKRWRMGGLGSILKSWQGLAHPVGTALSVNLPNGDILQGLYSGLNDDGSLRLRLADDQIHAIHAADVFLI
jgi:BirA family transcriptional regulator, biotin operon repressor / biotin---[acetyl-CoA-carboxylase] ligase